MNIKKQLTLSNAISVLLIVFLLAMIVIPSFKGTVMRGLLKTGLFAPDVPRSNAGRFSAAFAATVSTEAIRFKDPQGRIIALADLKGKVVFLNFWATWCPPCIAEMPAIQQFYDRFKADEQVVFLLVDVDNRRKNAEQFMQKHDFTLPVYTPASPVPEAYMDGSIPTSLVLDKDGRVVFKHEGMGDYANAEFQAFIAQLINE